MVHALFKAGDDSYKAKRCLSQYVIKLKEALKVQSERLDEVGRQSIQKAEELKKAREEVEWLKKDNEDFHKANEELRSSLKEA